MMAAAMLSPVKLMKLAMNPLEEELVGLVGITKRLVTSANFDNILHWCPKKCPKIYP